MVQLYSTQIDVQAPVCACDSIEFLLATARISGCIMYLIIRRAKISGSVRYSVAYQNHNCTDFEQVRYMTCIMYKA